MKFKNYWRIYLFTLHLPQVIKYLTFLLLQERFLLMKCFNCYFRHKFLQMSQELHGVVIFNWLLPDFE